MPPKFNHLVVLMLENRSFDHMLGRLYHHDNPDPYHLIPRGQVFDGVSDDMFNSVFAFPGPDLPPSAVNAHRTTNFKTPAQFDIGHSFDAVKLQINGSLPGSLSQMDGFIASRLADLRAAEPNHTITQTETAEPMAGFSPTTHTASGAGPFADARVICSLARNFAVCDNWHASVPGPTFPNRSFLHAGTSNGFVSNSDPAPPTPPGSKPKPPTFKKWSQHHAPTIFNRMKEAGLSAKIYHGGGGPTGFPALVYELHPPITRAAFPPNTFHNDFLDDAQGKHKRKLPEYSFIEPDVIGSDTNWNPNDQHPARDIRWGEDLIQQVYQAISTGPFWDDTLLIITYDEHGGFFDHRYPPAALPPSLVQLGEENFAFTQAGVRIPAVLVSPRIEAGTVFHPTCPVDHTSVIRTLCARWNLPPLTMRDAAACDLAAVLGDTVRTDLPTIPPVDLSNASPENLPLNDLQKDYLALVAANRGIEPPHMETEDHARAFLATVANKPPKAAG